jgi:hypothetical protein
VIQITHERTVVGASAGELESAREWFREHGYVKLRGLLEPRLLASLLDAIDRSEFRHRVHDGIGTELCAEGAASTALEFLMNDPALVATVSTITECGTIGCFEGRVYRLVPESGHYDSWHSDVGQDRLVALSINLGRVPYEGGRLQIRRAEDKVMLGEIENRTAGDAVMFRVHPTLRHRVGPVEGKVPRTAYAGWFRTQPNFRELLRQRLSRRGE